MIKISFFIALLFVIILLPLSVTSQILSAGGRHSLLICKDSTVQSWGYNGYGQLGNGTIMEQHTGVHVLGLSEIICVAGGLFHSIFIKQDGTAWTCGRNALGPLGDGSNTDRHIPVQVSGLSDVVSAAGGGEHSLFLKKNQMVWACGANVAGQLGDGTRINRQQAVEIKGLKNIIQIAAGAEFSLFLDTDGNVWACGHNGFGQFGNGTNTSSNIPIHINGLSDIIHISAGEWHALFVKRDGTVFSCGRNNYGQLGDGTTIDNNLAKQIPELNTISQADAGGIHSVFLKRDGTVFACGLNSGGNNDGQLGDGTAIDRNKPVQVIPSWGMDAILHTEATREHSLFLSVQGAVWASGRNNYGQLGIGMFTNFNYLEATASKKHCPPLLVQQSELNTNGDKQIRFINTQYGQIQIQLNEEIKNATLRIYDYSGNCLINKSIHQDKVITIDMERIASGFYLLSLSQDNKVQSHYKFFFIN